MTAEVIRLYCCPQCDEFIEEDDYADHEEGCEPLKLSSMTDFQLNQYVNERIREDPQWAEHENQVEGQIDSLLNGTLANGGMAHFAYGGGGAGGSYASINTGGAGFASPSMSFNMHSVHVPRGFDRSVTKAVIRRQLFEKFKGGI